jgi:N6-adenosine-specific RNA methylase IME4
MIRMCGLVMVKNTLTLHTNLGSLTSLLWHKTQRFGKHVHCGTPLWLTAGTKADAVVAVAISARMIFIVNI